MGKRLSDEIKAQIIQDREAGMTCAAVARKYRVSDSVVSNVTKEAFGDDYKTQEFKDWFRLEWANIYPGDKRRKEKLLSDDYCGNTIC